MSRPPPSRLDTYPIVYRLQTRWADNDVYGHVNNATFYGLIDTAVNRFMIARAGIDIRSGPLIALVVETGCRYHDSIVYPEDVDVGLKVVRVGRSSVTWHVGLFGTLSQSSECAAADAHFVHVLVDRETRRPALWPDAMRNALTAAIG